MPGDGTTGGQPQFNQVCAFGGSELADKALKLILQLVAQAKDGGRENLWELQRAMDRGGCSLPAIRAILGHLRLELVPNLAVDEHEREPHATYAQNAFPCVTILSTVARALHANPSLRDAAIPLLSDTVDGICL